MKIGFHCSIKGGVENAVKTANDMNYTTFQIFTRSSRSWSYNDLNPSNIKEFKKLCKQWKYDEKVVHMPYLPNFATSNNELREKSIDSLRTEIRRCDLLDINYLVLHIGSHKGEGIEKGIENVITHLNEVMHEEMKVEILLETSAGQKNSVGSKFEEINQILNNLVSPAGVCLDTCHVFAAGYDLRTGIDVEKTLDQFNDVIGWDKLKVVHINDSKSKLGGGRDRHEHIGKGNIGEEGFRIILNHKIIKKLPIILETPNKENYGDKENFLKVNELAIKL